MRTSTLVAIALACFLVFAFLTRAHGDDYDAVERVDYNGCKIVWTDTYALPEVRWAEWEQEVRVLLCDKQVRVEVRIVEGQVARPWTFKAIMTTDGVRAWPDVETGRP